MSVDACDVPRASISMPFRPLQGRGSGCTTAALLGATPSLAEHKTLHGAFPGGDFRPDVMTLQVMVWSGNRTRDSQLSKLMLYPLSYPVLTCRNRTGDHGHTAVALSA